MFIVHINDPSLIRSTEIKQ